MFIIISELNKRISGIVRTGNHVGPQSVKCSGCFQLNQSLKENEKAQEILRKGRHSELKEWLASGGEGGPRDKAKEKYPHHISGGAGNNPKQTATSSFIAGDGIVRRKMMSREKTSSPLSPCQVVLKRLSYQDISRKKIRILS